MPKTSQFLPSSGRFALPPTSPGPGREEESLARAGWHVPGWGGTSALTSPSLVGAGDSERGTVSGLGGTARRSPRSDSVGGLRPLVLPLWPSPAWGRAAGAHRAWFVRPNYQLSGLPELAGQRDLQCRNRLLPPSHLPSLIPLQAPTAQCQPRPPAQGGQEPGPGEGEVGAGQSPAVGGLTLPLPFPLRFLRRYRRALRSSSAFPPLSL